MLFDELAKQLGFSAGAQSPLRIPLNLQKLPALPIAVKTLNDAQLRARARDAWRVSHHLRATLNLWKHFVFLAASGGSIDEATTNAVNLAYPGFRHLGAALEALLELQGGNQRVDCNVVAEFLQSARQEIDRQVVALHRLGVNMQSFNCLWTSPVLAFARSRK